jgi:ketosteroid isomerase-like protein
VQGAIHQGAEAIATLAAATRFHDAVNRRDVEAVMAAMTADCVFESTYPPPDGPHVQGQAAVGSFFTQLFAASRQLRFETEEMFACGDRCVVRWRYQWIDLEGRPGHVRGVDVFRVRDGKVAEKLSYVKG